MHIQIRLLYSTGTIVLFQPKKNIYEQIKKSKTVVENIINAPVPYFRPPYGLFSVNVLSACKELKLKLAMWNKMSYDFDERISDDFILNFINKKIKGGDIIVFHDGHIRSDRTVRILGRVIKIIKDKGFDLSAL